MEEQCATKEFEVEIEMKLLSKEIENLSGLVSLMSERLKPVLKNHLKDDENTGVPQAELVPLANSIRNNRYNVQNENRILRNLLDRIGL